MSEINTNTNSNTNSNICYIYPGDNINHLITKKNKLNNIKIGNGLISIEKKIQNHNNEKINSTNDTYTNNNTNNDSSYDIQSTQFGVLQFKSPNTYYVSLS